MTDRFTIRALMDLKPVVVVSDGTAEGIVLTDLSDRERATFRAVIRHKEHFRLGYDPLRPMVAAEYATPLGVAAALYAACFGHLIILRAPKEVMEAFGTDGNWEIADSHTEGETFGV